jgi:hypothetical protein
MDLDKVRDAARKIEKLREAPGFREFLDDWNAAGLPPLPRLGVAERE